MDRRERPANIRQSVPTAHLTKCSSVPCGSRPGGPSSVPRKNPWVNLVTVRRPQKFREFVGGLVREFRRRLPAREVPPMTFLEVADDSEEIRLEAVMGRPVVQRGSDYKFAADRHDSELVVSHGRGRISARTPHARLHKIPDHGQQAFDRLRLDGQVATGRKGHARFSRTAEQVYGDRAGGGQEASPWLQGILRETRSGRVRAPLVAVKGRRRSHPRRASGLVAMGSRPPQEESAPRGLNSFGVLFPNRPSANLQTPPPRSNRHL